MFVSWAFSILTITIINAAKLAYYILWVMVFNATFNNISVISWRSLLLVEETAGPGENYRPVYRGGHFYWWRKPQDPEKTTDLPQVTDKFIYYMMLCYCTCCILYILCYVSFNISIELIIQDKLFYWLYLAFDSELKKSIMMYICILYALMLFLFLTCLSLLSISITSIIWTMSSCYTYCVCVMEIKLCFFF